MKKLVLFSLGIFFHWNAIASQIDTLFIFSESMQKKIANTVILPDSYKTKNKAFPVFYLLHGVSGNYKDWITLVPKIKAYADTYNFIIVCPDGHETSWYLDSPMDTTMRYETYISKELIAEVDKKYRTVKNNTGRAISGLSMGGHGALSLAFKHPDIFGAAGSMSGGVNLEKFPDNWKIAMRLGSYEEYPENWKNNSVVNMVDLAKESTLKIIFDCGVDDFFYDVNKELHHKMLLLDIPHDYIERPGNHDWNYWANAIKYHMVFFSDYFASDK